MYTTFWFRPILSELIGQPKREPKTCLQWPCESCRHKPAADGIGGHYGSYLLHRLLSLPQIHFQRWLALPPTRDHQLSRQPLQGPPESSLSYALVVQEFAGAVVAIDEHQVVDTWDE